MENRIYKNCPKCGVVIRDSKLKRHLRLFHGIQNNQPTTYTLTDEERVGKIKTKNYQLLLQASYIWNNHFLNEENEQKREQVLSELYSLKSKYPEISPENKYLQDIINTLLKKPTLKEYRNSCEKIFITWDNIEFLNNKIKINHKDFFSLKPIQIIDSKESLNLIKVEYFKRVYHNQIYKLYVINNEIKEEISPDLKKIRAVIEIQLEEIQKKKKNQKNLEKKEKIFPKNASQSQIIEIIGNLPESKFKFIKIAAKFLTENDQVLAFIENNNSNFEEALIFIFKRPKLNFVLWENINESRGAYLFKFPQPNFKQELSRLVSLLKSSIHNKREKFFRNEDNFNLEYKSKIFLNHEDLFRYRWQIKKHLNTAEDV